MAITSTDEPTVHTRIKTHGYAISSLLHFNRTLNRSHHANLNTYPSVVGLVVLPQGTGEGEREGIHSIL